MALHSDIKSLPSASLARLDRNRWLNDLLLSNYMDLLTKYRASSEPNSDSFTILDTNFWPVLMVRGVDGVRSRFKRATVRNAKTLIIPVHYKGVHWCLAVIDQTHKSIFWMDSIRVNRVNELERLTKFAQDVLQHQSWKTVNVLTPEQKNSSDCGVFTCVFAEAVTRRAPIPENFEDHVELRLSLRRQILHQTLQPFTPTFSYQGNLANIYQPVSSEQTYSWNDLVDVTVTLRDIANMQFYLAKYENKRHPKHFQLKIGQKRIRLYPKHVILVLKSARFEAPHIIAEQESD